MEKGSAGYVLKQANLHGTSQHMSKQKKKHEIDVVVLGRGRMICKGSVPIQEKGVDKHGASATQLEGDGSIGDGIW